MLMPAFENYRGEGGISRALRSAIVAAAFLDDLRLHSRLQAGTFGEGSRSKSENLIVAVIIRQRVGEELDLEAKDMQRNERSGCHQLASARLAVICCALVPPASRASADTDGLDGRSGGECHDGDQTAAVDSILRHGALIAAYGEGIRNRAPSRAFKLHRRVIKFCRACWMRPTRREYSAGTMVVSPDLCARPGIST